MHYEKNETQISRRFFAADFRSILIKSNFLIKIFVNEIFETRLVACIWDFYVVIHHNRFVFASFSLNKWWPGGVTAWSILDLILEIPEIIPRLCEQDGWSFQNWKTRKKWNELETPTEPTPILTKIWIMFLTPNISDQISALTCLHWLVKNLSFFP